jgi:hypothetical protein
MNYEPKHEDIVDMFLTQHSEERIHIRFPGLKFKYNLKVFLSYCESPKAEPMWAIPISGGYVIGKWIAARPGSYIKGIFIAQTALLNWQFKRSGFTKIRSVQVQFRRINSQIENKSKCGKGEVHVVETPTRRDSDKVDRSAASTVGCMY